MKKIVYNLSAVLFFLFHSISSNAQGGIWTYMHGSDSINQLGVYGIKGVPDTLNTPAGRYQGAYWTDLQGNFWLFGGFHPYGYADDLWKYTPATQQWTWMNGPQATNDQNGEYGIKGVSSPNNYPSARTFGPNC